MNRCIHPLYPSSLKEALGQMQMAHETAGYWCGSSFGGVG